MMKSEILLNKILFLPFLFASASLFAQSSLSLKGKITESPDLAVPGANVRLMFVKDSALAKLSLSDAQGNFLFENIKPGNYFLKVFFLGYQEHTSAAFQLNADKEGVIIRLEKTPSELNEVIVTAKKTAVEQLLDRLVLNVGTDITAAGSSALEVLQKAPGISLDQNGNLSMRGKSGTAVMINGKPVQMSGQELAELLRGISADNIQKIDLITTPPANYDAAGTAGIIDIRLKKDKRQGASGNISLGGGAGRRYKTNNGFSLNNRQGKLALYASYNLSDRGDFVTMDIDRSFYQDDAYTGGFRQDYHQDIIYRSHNARAGADYQLSKTLNLGIELNGNFIKIERSTDSKADLFESPGVTSGFRNSLAESVNGRNNYGINLNALYKLKKEGSLVSADADYARFSLDDIQTYDISHLNAERQENTTPYTLFNDAGGALDIYSLKVSYSMALKNGAKLESGAKSSLVNSSTLLDFYNRSGGSSVFDEDLSSDFRFREYIQAAYVNFTGKLGRLDIQAGLRAENTHTEGRELSAGGNFNRNYFSLFPSSALSYAISKSQTIGLTLSRRISRPTYNQLSPFYYFLDPGTRFSGNPALLSSLSYAADLNYTLLKKYNLVFSYAFSKNPILDVQLPSGKNDEVIYQQPDNLRRFENYAIVTSIPLDAGRWFTSFNNISAYYSIYAGSVAGKAVNRSKPYLYFSSDNTFQLGKEWSLQLAMNYTGRQISGIFDIKPISMVSGGLQKRFLNKKASLRLSVYDWFFGGGIRSQNRMETYANYNYWRRDSRTAILNFNYRFGGKDESKRKTGGAEEEKRRAG